MVDSVPETRWTLIGLIGNPTAGIKYHPDHCQQSARSMLGIRRDANVKEGMCKSTGTRSSEYEPQNSLENRGWVDGSSSPD